MTFSKTTLMSLTRRVSFLWKYSLLLGGAIVLIGTGISMLNTNRLDSFNSALSTIYSTGLLESFDDPSELRGSIDVSDALLEVLNSDKPFPEKLKLVQELCSISFMLKIPDLPESSTTLSNEEHRVAIAFILTCLNTGEDDELLPLIELTKQNTPFAHYALALHHLDNDAITEALESLKQDIQIHNSDPARELMIQIYIMEERADDIYALITDPDFNTHITPRIRLHLGLTQLDWALVVTSHFPAAYGNINVSMAILATLSGVVWMLILLSFGGSCSWSSWPVKLALPALLLGALSTHSTLFWLYWQEYQLGFTQGSTPVNQFLYCVFGIGLREEATKLLCFIPLIPFIRKRSQLEILTVAGLVGLGFAIEENINYFEQSSGLSALGRFATANFLHIALTAMAGLAVTRAVNHRGRHIEHAVITFGTVVIIHGLYDAFLIVSLLQEYAIFASTIFVLMGYQYFGLLRGLRETWRDPISTTSIFTFGAVAVTSLSYCLYAWQFGPRLAFQNIGGEVIGVAVILIMFYREIPEGIR